MSAFPGLLRRPGDSRQKTIQTILTFAPVLRLRLRCRRGLAIVLVRAACGQHLLELLLLGSVRTASILLFESCMMARTLAWRSFSESEASARRFCIC